MQTFARRMGSDELGKDRHRLGVMSDRQQTVDEIFVGGNHHLVEPGGGAAGELEIAEAGERVTTHERQRRLEGRDRVGNLTRLALGSGTFDQALQPVGVDVVRFDADAIRRALTNHCVGAEQPPHV